MDTINYTDLFLMQGISIPPEDQSILNHWFETQHVLDGFGAKAAIL